MSDQPVIGIGSCVRYTGEYVPNPSPEGDLGGLENGALGLVARDIQMVGGSLTVEVVFPGWQFVWALPADQLEVVSRETLLIPMGYTDEMMPLMVSGQFQIAERIFTVAQAQRHEQGED